MYNIIRAEHEEFHKHDKSTDILLRRMRTGHRYTVAQNQHAKLFSLFVKSVN